MVGLGRWRAAGAAAGAAVLVATTMGRGAPAGAQTGDRAAAPAITVTPLTGPDGQPMVSAGHVNDAGLVVGQVAEPPTPWVPGTGRRVVARQGDSASYVSGSGVVSTLLDVSERGQVVGRSGAHLLALGFSWRAGVLTHLAEPGAEPFVSQPFFPSASAVNERGHVLGLRVSTADPLFVETAVWQDGRVVAATRRVPDGEQAARPKDLNDRGQALVDVPRPDGTSVAAVWRIGGRTTELGTLGGRQSWGSAIDERGRVAGVSETASGDRHAFLWQRGRMVDLGTLGGATSLVGELPPEYEDVDDAVNDRGEVAGTSETASGDEHAFLWSRGRMVDLGTLGGATSHATALNNRGQVVGYSETESGERHAFLWQRGRMIDLGALVGAGESEATDVNDRGEIVGRVGDRAVMWSAAPPGGG